MEFTGPDTAGKSALFCKVASTLLFQMSYSVPITSAHTENVKHCDTYHVWGSYFQFVNNHMTLISVYKFQWMHPVVLIIQSLY
jgi:hypothetical protein